MDDRATPLNFLPLPVQIPIRHRDRDAHWSVSIARGLVVENAPPVRLIRHDERVVGSYALDSQVEERFMLLRIIELGWITAVDLAPQWGLHRNTLGNWAWRYRFFGLDGLVSGRLPAKPQDVRAILAIAKRVVAEQGRECSVVALQRTLAAHGWELRHSTCSELRVRLLRPEEQALILEGVADDNEGDDDQEPPATGAGCAEGCSSPVGETKGADRPDQACTALVPLMPVPCGLVPVPAEALPPPPRVTDVRLQQAGVALVLPAAQALLEPLVPYLEEHWGGRPWYYRPLDMILSFMLYLLAGFKNPEQVKAAPTPDFGPLLGRRRGPACITLRRRLPTMAGCRALTEELQRRIAEGYLRLGWIVPGWWLIDGHFSPYFGRQRWAKGWWPQRRMPQPGYQQEWVHDRRGRPLWLHVTQGFELFADQIPLVADSLRVLFSAAGQTEPLVMVFDRGGYNATVFRNLNGRGVGWVTWLKGKVTRPAEEFTQVFRVPASRPDQPEYNIHYTTFTHRVEGCHDQVAAVAWHHGDPADQVALLHNTDQCQPGRWSVPELISMLDNRWCQENAFKGMVRQVDIDWTNGYAHEPCATTEVPNPQVRRLHARLAQRVAQLRRAMDRPAPVRAAAAARRRRRLGTLQGQVTRLTRRLHALPSTVPYGSLGRSATTQLHPSRGLFFPVLRATTYHLLLQLRDQIAAVFPDRREHDKVLRVFLQTPGRYVHSSDADWIVLRQPHLPRYAAAMTAVLQALNASKPHAPGCPDRPLRFALEN